MGSLTPGIALSIESSCDETAVAFVNENGWVIDQVLFSQIEIHKKFGGVVPEIASRSHFEVLDSLVSELFARNPTVKKTDITFVCATKTPGLIGPLLVGATYAEAFAKGLGVEFRGVHHLRGHLAGSLLSEQSTNVLLVEKAKEIFPALVLLASGGHTSILKVNDDLKAQSLIKTVDDAAGECFDKSAKLMGLGYPGGPVIEKLADEFWLNADQSQKDSAMELAKTLPVPKTQEGDFSFSGLKTAIRLTIEKAPQTMNIGLYCWAVQNSIAESLEQGVRRSLKKISAEELAGIKTFVFCGGVAANKTLRSRIQNMAVLNKMEFLAPPIKYCTDNAAMIGASAWVQAKELAPKQIQARSSL